MSGIALNDQLLWDYLEGKSQFSEKYSQLLINNTDPNKFQGKFTPLAFALKQKNATAARLMLKSQKFLVQDQKFSALRQAMVVALNSDSDDIREIGEEILLMSGHLSDDAFTIGDKRYTPLSYLIQFKQELFNTFFENQRISIHTMFMAVEKAFEVGALSIAKNILTVFKNDPKNKIYSSVSPISDPETSYGKYDNEWIKLFIDNGADATRLLFEAIKRSDIQLVIFLVGSGVSLDQNVFVEDQQTSMRISTYLVRVKPQMIDAVLEGIKFAPEARLAAAAFEAIDSRQYALAKKIIKAFINHPDPVVEHSSDNLMILKFAIDQDANEIADKLLSDMPNTGKYIKDTDDTLFSYVIRNHPHWINRILEKEKKLLVKRNSYNINKRKVFELPFKENMLVALRAAFEVDRIDVFEDILKLRDGLNPHAIASLSASCSRNGHVKLLDLVAASDNPRYQELLLAYGAQLNPPIKPIEIEHPPINNEFHLAVTDAFNTQQYRTFIDLLQKKPEGYRLERHLINALEIKHVGLQISLLRLVNPQDLYRNIEGLLIAALNNNINFIVELVRRGLDIHNVMDISTGDTSVLGYLIQNEAFPLVNNIIKIYNHWGQRSYYAVSAAIVKNKLDIAGKILKRCQPEVTLNGGTVHNAPIYDAAYQAAIRGYFPLVVTLVARGASIDLSIILNKATDEELKIILVALKTKTIDPAKAVEVAIRENRNNALTMMLDHPLVIQDLQNQDIALSLLSTAISQDNFAAAQLVFERFKQLLRFNDKVMELLLICAKGQQPGHEAIALKLLDLRKILVARQANEVVPIDLCTIDDKTVLEMSAATGKIELVNELIKHHNADPLSQRMQDQPTALSLTMTNRHRNIARLITTHAAESLNSLLSKRPYNKENFPSYSPEGSPSTTKHETSGTAASHYIL